MKIGCLISGGKDSWYAANTASKDNEIKCLIAIKSKNKESYMFHVPNIDLVEKQAECCGVPLIFMPSSGKKEEELEDLKQAIELVKARYHVEGVSCGAIKSNYQQERISKICEDLGLKLIAPSWDKDEDYYMHNLLLSNFDIIIVGIAADGFNSDWLGRKLDAKCLQDLRELKRLKGVSLIGEGGEMESFVLNCPLFKKKKLKILESEKIMDSSYSGYLKIKKVELVDK
jgi:asparagine synthase (glutamine-hydrolysing)